MSLTRLKHFFMLLIVPFNTMGQSVDTQIQSNALILKNWERSTMNQLLTVGVGSMAVGLVMMQESFGQNYDQGIQHLTWGTINTTIATLALRGISKRDYPNLNLFNRTNQLKRVLKINALLDLVYIGVGTAFILSNNDQLMGHGRGVVTQGSFLFLFDVLHMTRIQRFQKNILRF